ncbi:MAG: DUF202 domain-containing protein [Cyanobacteria bacterium SZAS-4]|nr:DUF202 domain-containing protein [Cyanobacteria bacterium SZAS-4]
MDRTLLAWVRTSLSLIGFGFTLAKFVHDLIVSGSIHGLNSAAPRRLGIALMVLGIGGLLGGAYDYKRSVKQLGGSVDISIWSPSLVVALILAVLSVYLTFNLVSNLSS